MCIRLAVKVNTMHGNWHIYCQYENLLMSIPFSVLRLPFNGLMCVLKLKPKVKSIRNKQMKLKPKRITIIVQQVEIYEAMKTKNKTIDRNDKKRQSEIGQVQGISGKTTYGNRIHMFTLNHLPCNKQHHFP